MLFAGPKIRPWVSIWIHCLFCGASPVINHLYIGHVRRRLLFPFFPGNETAVDNEGIQGRNVEYVWPGIDPAPVLVIEVRQSAPAGSIQSAFIPGFPGIQELFLMVPQNRSDPLFFSELNCSEIIRPTIYQVAYCQDTVIFIGRKLFNNRLQLIEAAMHIPDN